MPKYVLTASDGSQVEADGNHYPTADEQAAIFSAAGLTAPARAGGRALKPEMANSMRAAGIEPEGRSTGMGGMTAAGEPSKAETWLQTPMGRPTGIDAIDAQATPANALLLAFGFHGAAADAVQAASQWVKNAGADVAPDLIGMFSPRVAHALRVLQKVGRAEAPAAEAGAVPRPADMNAPHLDRSVPARPSAMTPEQLAQRAQYGHGTPAATRRISSPAPIERPAAPMPPEAAPAETPVAAQAPVETPTSSKVSAGKIKLTGDEVTEFKRLLDRGMPETEAMRNVLVMRQLAARLGGASPSQVRASVAHRNATGEW